MRHEDLFVGLLGIAIGLFLLGSSATDSDWVFRPRSGRWLAERLGRPKARLVLGLLGVVAMVIGIATAFGYVLHR